jgi:hypothetical protein
MMVSQTMPPPITPLLTAQYTEYNLVSNDGTGMTCCSATGTDTVLAASLCSFLILVLVLTILANPNTGATAVGLLCVTRIYPRLTVLPLGHRNSMLDRRSL